MTELIISELLYLQNESQEKPVLMYINSPGTTTEDGQPTGFESEAFAIYDTMNYCKAPVHTVRRPLLPPCPYRPTPATAPAPITLPLPHPLPPIPTPYPLALALTLSRCSWARPTASRPCCSRPASRASGAQAQPQA